MAGSRRREESGRRRGDIELGFGGLSASPGDHIGQFYNTASEWREVAAGYLRVGLEANEKCVYLLERGDPREELRAALAADGHDVDGALESGQLVFDSGRGSPEELRRFLGESLRDADERFGFLRWAGDITWSLHELPTTRALMEWESACNVVEDEPVVFLCQYDLGRFLGDVVIDAMRTHPYCIVGSAVHENPYYEDPGAFLAAMEERPEAALALR